MFSTLSAFPAFPFPTLLKRRKGDKQEKSITRNVTAFKTKVKGREKWRSANHQHRLKINRLDKFGKLSPTDHSIIEIYEYALWPL